MRNCSRGWTRKCPIFPLHPLERHFAEHREPPAVGFLQQLGCERFLRRAVGDEAHVEQEEAVEVVGGGGEVVVDADDGAAAGLDVL